MTNPIQFTERDFDLYAYDIADNWDLDTLVEYVENIMRDKIKAKAKEDINSLLDEMRDHYMVETDKELKQKLVHKQKELDKRRVKIKNNLIKEN